VHLLAVWCFLLCLYLLRAKQAEDFERVRSAYRDRLRTLSDEILTVNWNPTN